MEVVYGNCEKKNGNDARLYVGFERMKCISNPWRWIYRTVVNEVKDLKNLWVMHDPVRPVEISIVNNEHQWKCSKKIEPTILFYFFIMSSVWLDFSVFNRKQWKKCKKQHGDD